MRLRISWGKYIVYNVLISIMVYILMSALLGFFSLNFKTFVILYISAGVNLFLYLAYIYPYFGLFVPALILASGAIYYFTKKEKFILLVQVIRDTLNDSFLWFGEYIYNKDSLNIRYSNIIIIGVIVIITLILFYLIVEKRYMLISMAAGAAATSILWFMGYSKALNSMQQYVFVSFLLFGFANYESMENRWKLKQNVYSKKVSAAWGTCTISVLLIVFLLASLIPVSAGHMDYQWFNENILCKITDKWAAVADEKTFSPSVANEKFNISSVGFQEKPSKLGGPVRSTSSVPVFKVKTSSKIKTPVYLRGSVSNYYTGSTWTKRETEVYTNDDNVEIGRLSGNTENIRRITTVIMTVYPQSINTTSIFNIWRPYRVDIADKNYYYDDDGEVYLPKTADRHKEYTVISNVPTVYSDELRKAPTTKPGDSLGKYLQLPDTLPDRVRSLSLDITEKYRNNYDKAVAIEQYLRENFPYTLSPSSVPDGKDFVDYFLFEDKKGYCTYFASAMAVMCRAAGIPSRYVEGFVLETSDLDEQGFYNVRSDKAHAWVELYFEGYGWMKFEPTSSYTAADYTRTEANMPVSNSINEYPESSSNTESNTKTDIEVKKEALSNRSVPIYVYIILSAVFVILMRIMLKMYFKRRSIDRADNLNGRDAAMEYMSILEKKLKTGGVKRQIHETPREFGQRIDTLLSPFGIDFMDIVNIFDSIRFGNTPFSADARNKFKLAINNVDRFIKHRKGRIKYILFKYIL